MENALKVDRAFSVDVLTIDNELDGRSELATDQERVIDRDSNCIEYVDAAVKSLNSNNVNAYDKSIPFAINMHNEAAWANAEATKGTDNEDRLLRLTLQSLSKGNWGCNALIPAHRSRKLTNFTSTDALVERKWLRRSRFQRERRIK
jgi:hypothetical protein